MSNIKALFKNIDFRKLWIGQVISALGDRFTQMSLLTIVMILSADTGNKMAWITFYSLLPFLLFSQVFGAIADRTQRKKVMVSADVLRALLVASIPSLRYISQDMSLLYIVVFLVGTLSALFSPAKMALIPNLVHKQRLTSANSLVVGTGMIATLIGTLIAGFIIKFMGVTPSFYINAGAYILSAIIIIGILEPKHIGIFEKTFSLKGIFFNIREGMGYINRHQLIMRLVQLSAVFSVLSSFFYITTLNYGAIHLKVASEGIGILLASLGIGMSVGAVWLGRRIGRLNYNQILSAGFFLIGVSSIVFLSAPGFGISILLLILAGSGGSLILITLDSILQKTIPNSARASTFGAKGLITNLYFLLGLVVVGELTKVLGSRTLFAFIGFLSGVCAITVYLSDKELGYLIVKAILRLLLRLLFQLKISGIENLPRQKKVILAGNHTSLLDGVIVMAAYPRRVYFLTAERVLKMHTFYSWLARQLGFIPVRKGRANKEALVEAIRILEGGKSIAIFPEGKITEDGNITEAKQGMAVLAQKGEAVVLPFAIEGAYEAWHASSEHLRRFPVEIRFGKPVTHFAEELPEELTGAVMAEVKKMKIDMEKEGYLRVDPAELIKYIIYPR